MLLKLAVNIRYGAPDPPLSTSSPKPSPDVSLNVTDACSSTSRASRKVDCSKISRLLDHLTYDDDGLCEYDDIEPYNTDDICFYPVNTSSQPNSDKGLLPVFFCINTK